jgi:hypothetical protein
LFAWRSDAPADFKVKDGLKGRRRRRCAARILEFKVRWRRIASKQSMNGFAQARASHVKREVGWAVSSFEIALPTSPNVTDTIIR